MTKTELTREDGRYLIYYSFKDELVVESDNSGSQKNGAPGLDQESEASPPGTEPGDTPRDSTVE